jgi:hypothetical protein
MKRSDAAAMDAAGAVENPDIRITPAKAEIHGTAADRSGGSN